MYNVSFRGSGIQAQLSWASALGSLIGCSQGVGQDWVLCEGLTEESAFKLIYGVVDRIHFLLACWTELLSSFLAVG